MKLWIDDVRPAPIGYFPVHSVKQAKAIILLLDSVYAFVKSVNYTNSDYFKVELLDLDHDAGIHAAEGGDFIELLKWLETEGRNYPIHIHSMNIVGVQNMRAIIKKNGWLEV